MNFIFKNEKFATEGDPISKIIFIFEIKAQLSILIAFFYDYFLIKYDMNYIIRITIDASSAIKS